MSPLIIVSTIFRNPKKEILRWSGVILVSKDSTMYIRQAVKINMDTTMMACRVFS